MAHRNARLTQFGRRLLVQRITELGWPPAQAAESLGCREPPPTSGLPATAPKGRPAWPTAARGRSTAPMPCPLPRSGGCWRPAGAVARVPPARLPPRPAPLDRLWVLRRHGMSRLATPTGPAGWRSATSGSGPASWSTWTSRSWAASLMWRPHDPWPRRCQAWPRARLRPCPLGHR
jgi:hypothetical protein